MNSITKGAGVIAISFFMGAAVAQDGMTDTESGATTDTMTDTQATENLRSQKSQRYPGTNMDQNNARSSQVRDVQSALSSRGYALQVDGISGKNTRNALMEFQKDQGIEQTGQMDEATLSALNVESSDRVPASVSPGTSMESDSEFSTDSENTDADY